MKFLMLLLSFLFALSISCGEGDSSSSADETEENGSAENGSKKNDPKKNKQQEEGLITKPVLIPNPPPKTTPDSLPPNFCSADCRNDDAKCSAKYNNCLRPKAGNPASTQKTTCKKAGEDDRILILSKWNANPRTNSLLCDLTEDLKELRYLRLFATNTRDACEKKRDEIKKELETQAYQCSSQ